MQRSRENYPINFHKIINKPYELGQVARAGVLDILKINLLVGQKLKNIGFIIF